MLCLIGGMPRSATTWVFNVADRILKNRGIFCKKLNAGSPAELDNFIAGYRPEDDLLIHFHDISQGLQKVAGQPHVRITFNYRDPRDVVCSQMTLHQAQFEHVVAVTGRACQNFSAAVRLPGVMLLPYYSASQHSEAVVFQLSFYLGHMIGQREVEEICRETSVEKVRAVMERVDKGGSDTESTFTGIRHVKYDPDTLINDRHIQSGEIGRWKDELTKEQQQYVNQAFKEFLESAIL